MSNQHYIDPTLRRKDEWYKCQPWPSTRTEAAFQRSIAEQLRTVRLRKSMGVVELSRRSGLSTAAISCYLTGRRKLTFRALFKLADALGCTVEIDLISETEER